MHLPLLFFIPLLPPTTCSYSVLFSYHSYWMSVYFTRMNSTKQNKKYLHTYYYRLETERARLDTENRHFQGILDNSTKNQVSLTNFFSCNLFNFLLHLGHFMCLFVLLSGERYVVRFSIHHSSLRFTIIRCFFFVSFCICPSINTI